jgi:hypothetical protein
LTSLFHLVVFGVTKLVGLLDPSTSAIVGTSAFETDGAEGASWISVLLFVNIFSDVVFSAVFRFEAAGSLDDRADVREEKK